MPRERTSPARTRRERDSDTAHLLIAGLSAKAALAVFWAVSAMARHGPVREGPETGRVKVSRARLAGAVHACARALGRFPTGANTVLFRRFHRSSVDR